MDTPKAQDYFTSSTLRTIQATILLNGTDSAVQYAFNALYGSAIDNGLKFGIATDCVAFLEADIIEKITA